MPRERKERMVCEICRQAEATVHYCQAFGGGNRPMEKHDYCEACHRKLESAPGQTVDLPECTGDVCCYYCGFHMEMGTPNEGPALKARKLKYHWRCGRCFPIESTFIRAEFDKRRKGRMEGLARGLGATESMEALEDVYRRTDDHVRQVIGDDVQPKPWKPGAVRPYHPLGGKAKVVGPLAARDSRYAREAYLFVLTGVQRALAKGADVFNVSSHDLLAALRAQALDLFGAKAKATLNAWGVFQCEDFGEIVFSLVAEGLLGKTEDDQKEDFRGGYDFAAAFPG